jgi:hypothetical protein
MGRKTGLSKSGPAGLVWIVGRVAQRSRLPLHDRLWLREWMPPLRIDMVVK